MSTSRRPGAHYGSPEWRRRISAGLRRYHERRREAARVQPSDLVALGRPASEVRPEMLPLLQAGAEEAQALLEQLGGADVVSPAKRMLCDDVGRLGALLRALVARYAQTGHSEVASRVATVATARRQNLQAVGLERRARDVTVRDVVAALEATKKQDYA